MKIELASPLPCESVARAIGAEHSSTAGSFSNIATSSFEADENTLFFALDGRHTSGEEFVRTLAERGIFSVTRKRGAYMLTHENPRAALLSLAAYYKSTLPSLQKTVTITGSVGKTTTKELLRSILSVKWKTHANTGNFNSDIGMPLSILSAPQDTEMLILEIGMNHKGEIRPLAECAKADLGIITNIGHAHIGNLGSLEFIAREKKDICAHKEDMPVIIPENQPLLTSLKNKIEIGKNIVFQTQPHEGGKLCRLLYNETEGEIRIPDLSPEIESCLFLAVSAALTLGMKPEEIEQGVMCAPTFEHRRKEITLGGIKIIDDTYNASPESMRSGLRFLMSVKAKKRHAVLGDMLELGEYSTPLHEQLGKQLYELYPDYIYLLGEHVRHTRRILLQKGFPEERIFFYPDVKNHEGLVRTLSEKLARADACFLKASHSIKLWRVIEGLSEVYGE